MEQVSNLLMIDLYAYVKHRLVIGYIIHLARVMH